MKTVIRSSLVVCHMLVVAAVMLVCATDKPTASELLSSRSELQAWLQGLFDGKAIVGVTKTLPLKMPSVVSKSEIAANSEDLQCQQGSTRCLLLSLNYRIEKHANDFRVLELEPDSSLILYDKEGQSVRPLLTCGSEGRIHGAYWQDKDIAVVYGIEWGKGFVILIDFAASTRTDYEVQNAPLISKEREADFLIRKFRTRSEVPRPGP